MEPRPCIASCWSCGDFSCVAPSGPSPCPGCGHHLIATRGTCECGRCRPDLHASHAACDPDDVYSEWNYRELGGG
jgi:hypothetical protein